MMSSIITRNILQHDSANLYLAPRALKKRFGQFIKNDRFFSLFFHLRVSASVLWRPHALGHTSAFSLESLRSGQGVPGSLGLSDSNQHLALLRLLWELIFSKHNEDTMCHYALYVCLHSSSNTWSRLKLRMWLEYVLFKTYKNRR